MGDHRRRAKLRLVPIPALGSLYLVLSARAFGRLMHSIKGGRQSSPVES